MLRTLSKILDILTMAVGALGSISLLVGGVGIVTIMTIAVTERTGEIGSLSRSARRDEPFSASFSARAVALSALGGLFGLVLGMGLAQLIHLCRTGPAGAYAAQLCAARRRRCRQHRPARGRAAGTAGRAAGPVTPCARVVMNAPVIRQIVHLHRDAPPKPAPGAPCNGCGVCCAAETCPAGYCCSCASGGRAPR